MYQMFQSLWKHFSKWFYYHPLLQKRPFIKGLAVIQRYPSPGSKLYEPLVQDYRIPLTQSRFNVRYAFLTPSQLDMQSHQSKTTFVTRYVEPTRKLILLKFLNQSDKDNQKAVNEAKKKFKSVYGFNVQTEHFQNDFNIKLPKLNDREGLQKFYSQFSYIWSQVKKHNENYEEEQIDVSPNLFQPTMEYYVWLPFHQQSQLEVQYHVDHLINARIQKIQREGSLVSVQGSANYWKAIDEDNDPQNMKKIGQAVDDLQPLNYSIPNAKITYQYNQEGDVIKVNRQKVQSS